MLHRPTEMGTSKSAANKHTQGKNHEAKLAALMVKDAKDKETEVILKEKRLARQAQGFITTQGVYTDGQRWDSRLGHCGYCGRVQGMETVPVSVQVHRFDVLGALLEAGIPPNKIKKKKLRRLLEKGSGKLTSPAHLILTYLPQVALKDFKKIKEEVGDRPMASTTTGPPRRAKPSASFFAISTTT